MDTNKLGSQPAHPVIGSPGAPEDYPGLTKRELFAAMAMQGFAADPDMAHVEPRAIAIGAVSWADALLAELAKEQS